MLMGKGALAVYWQKLTRIGCMVVLYNANYYIAAYTVWPYSQAMTTAYRSIYLRFRPIHNPFPAYAGLHNMSKPEFIFHLLLLLLVIPHMQPTHPFFFRLESVSVLSGPDIAFDPAYWCVRTYVLQSLAGPGRGFER